MDFAHHSELDGLLGDDRPAFMFDGNGRLVWANSAAAAFWGVPDPVALLNTAGGERFAAAREQARVALRGLAPGASRLERLRLIPLGRTIPLTMQVKRLAFPQGARALLAVGLERMRGPKIASPREEDGPAPHSARGEGDDRAAGLPLEPLAWESLPESATSEGDAESAAERVSEANVVPFPMSVASADQDAAARSRQLDPEEQANLRTIARILGGPIAVPAPVDAVPTERTPQVGESVAEAAPTPASRSSVVANPPDRAISDDVPSAFYLPLALTPEIDPNAELLRAALERTRARAAELAGIIDTATDGVIVLSAQGRILSLNHAAEALFALDSEEVEGDPLTRLLAPESHRAAIDYLDGLARDGVAGLLNDGREVIGIEKKGGQIPLFMTIGRLGAGADARFCAVLRDVTQWKRAERDLTEAKRLAERASSQKSDFLAKVTHEIRTPLNAIIGFAEVMLEERFGRIENERYRVYLADIRASGEHLLSLVNDLLDLSKIEAGRLELSFAAVRLGDIVQQTVATMQPQANRQGVILRMSLPRIPPVVADARSLRQILFNLVSNAIKYTRSGGQVIVSAGMTDAGEIALRVRDTGQGMSEDEIALALEPFRQVAPRAGAAPTDGTGLGLPLTKALAEANRASFSIESTLGEGTLVQVTFPSTRVLAE